MSIADTTTINHLQWKRWKQYVDDSRQPFYRRMNGYYSDFECNSDLLSVAFWDIMATCIIKFKKWHRIGSMKMFLSHSCRCFILYTSRQYLLLFIYLCQLWNFRIIPVQMSGCYLFWNIELFNYAEILNLCQNNKKKK